MSKDNPDDSSQVITLTRFTATDDSTLAKEFYLDPDGLIKKKSHAQFGRGVARKVPLNAGLKSLQELIDDLESIECLSTGVFDAKKVRVQPQDATRDSESGLSIRHRTREAMRQPSPGLVLLDHDPSPRMPNDIRCDTPPDLMRLLVGAVPALADVGWVGRGSSSQGVFNKKTGDLYNRFGGIHVFLGVNTSDLGALKECLEVKCWIAGQGYVELARNGRRLLRAPIDLSVFSPERLIFEAAPTLGSGVGREEPRWSHHEGALLDIQNFELTDSERTEAQERQREAFKDRDLIEQAEAKYERYRRETANEVAKRTGEGAKAILDRIPRYQDAAMERQTVRLSSDHPVQIKGASLTFGNLVSRASEFDGQSMPDPIEGAAYGTSTAKFYANSADGSAVIHSWAHGVSTSYVLQAGDPAKGVDTGIARSKQSDPAREVVRSKPSVDLSTPLEVETFPHLTGDGRPKATHQNYRHMLAACGITVRYNVIAKEIEINIPDMKGTVDNRFASAMTQIESLAALNGLRTAPCARYINLIADEQQFNPIADWINSRSWDGASRLPELYETLTARDDFPDDLKQTLIYRWLLSAVAAVLKPSGFHCRGVLTLQGRQSLGKTSWIRNLVSHPHLQETYVLEGHHLDTANKDSILVAIQHWIVELGELDSSFKKDIARTKSFITNKTDKPRKPYAAAPSEFPRRTVFAASVNEDNFLVDPTGNSRWWVIPLVRIYYQHEIDMQQVFAQLAVDYRDGAQWWLTRDEEKQLEEQNRSHQAVDVIEETLLNALDHDLLEDQWPRMTASEVLRQLGFTNPSNKMAQDCGRVLRRHFGQPRKVKGRTVWQVPLRTGI